MNFTLNILGTASALPILNRYPSAQVLDVRGRLFLIDCGEGVQTQLRRMHISMLKIDTVLISHIHGDHTFGIFGLMSTMSLLGRTAPLHIYAPEAFGTVLDIFRSAYSDGIKYEIVHHPLRMTAPEHICGTRFLDVFAFPLRHRVTTFGFLFREKEPELNIRKEAVERLNLGISEIGRLKQGIDVVRPAGEIREPSPENGFVRCSGNGEPLVIRASDVTYRPYDPRSYAYCSDTAPFRELSEWVRGVDLLYHETTFPEELSAIAKTTFHSTTHQAAKCALDAGVGKLVTGHYSSRYADVSQFIREAREIFPDVVEGRDLMKIEVPLKRNC